MSDPTFADTGPRSPDERLIHRLAEEARTAPPQRAAVLLYELGRLYEVHLDQPEQALDAYHRSYKRYPSLSVAARALTRLLAARGEYAALPSMLEAELRMAVSDEERVSVLVERAQLRAERLDDLHGAHSDLARALELRPDDLVALTTLLEVCQRTGRLEEAERWVRPAARRTSRSSAAAGLLCRLARCRQLRGDNPEAADLYREALELDPDHPEVQESLLELALLVEDWEAADELFHGLDRADRLGAARLRDWARLVQERFGRTVDAAATLERAVEALPEAEQRSVLLELADLWRGSGRWEELADTLERAADLPGAGGQTAQLMFDLARVRLSRLNDTAGASAALERAVGADPTHEQAAALLGRMLSEAGRWQELARFWSERLALSLPVRPHDRATLALRLAMLLEHRLDDAERAANAYAEAVTSMPGWLSAQRGLARCLRRLSRFEQLAEALQKQLNQTDDPGERARLHRLLVELWDEDVDDLARSEEALGRLLEEHPDDPWALDRLWRLHDRAERWSDEAEDLQRLCDATSDPFCRAPLLARLARLRQHRLDDGPGALQAWIALLDTDPQHQEAVWEAERLLLAGISQQPEPKGDAAERFVRLTDPARHRFGETLHRCRMAIHHARLLGHTLHRWSEAAAAQSDALQLLLPTVELPLDSDSGDAVTRLAGILYDELRRTSRVTDVPPAVMLAGLSAAPQPSEPGCQVARLLELGRLSALNQEQPRALAAWWDALELGSHTAWAELLGRAMAQANLKQLHRLFKTRIRTSSLDADATSLQLAWVHATHPGDFARAARVLDRLGRARPRSVVPRSLLAVLLARLGRWQELTELLDGGPKEQADQSSEQEQEPSLMKVANALAVAGLSEHRLGDLSGAARQAYTVLRRFPQHAEALSILERRHRGTGDARGLVQVVGRQLASVQNSAEQAALLLELGAAHAVLGQTDEAATVYRKAAEGLSTHLPAARAWVRACRQEERSADLASALTMEANASRTAALELDCALEAARLWGDADPEMAVTAYRQVLSLDSSHAEAAAALEKLHTQRQEWQELGTLLEETAGSDPRRRGQALIRVARIRQEQLGDAGGAGRAVHQALRMTPGEPAMLEELVELARAGEHWDDLAVALRDLAEREETEERALDLLRESAQILHQRLQRAEEAEQTYRRVLELDPEDLDALRFVAERQLEAGRWAEAALAHERLLELDPERPNHRGYRLALARIRADGLDDAGAAVDDARRALEIDPGDLEATTLLVDLQQRAGQEEARAETLAASRDVHLARLARDPLALDSYRALRQVYAWRGFDDGAELVGQVLAALAPSNAEDHAAAVGSAPTRELTDEEIEASVLHRHERGPFYRVLQGSREALRRVFARRQTPPVGSQIVAAQSHPRLVAALDPLQQGLGIAPPTLYITPGRTATVRLVQGSTPALCLGQAALALPPTELTFLLGTPLARLRLGHHWLCHLPHDELGQLIAAILSLACRTFHPPYPAVKLAQLRQELDRAFSRPALRALAAPAQELADQELDPTRWKAAMVHSEDRLALLLTGDPTAALRGLAKKPPPTPTRGPTGPLPRFDTISAEDRLKDLLGFVIGKPHLKLRRTLGLSKPITD